MSDTQLLIDRSNLPESSRDLSIDSFLTGMIDYRNCGSRQEQLDMLYADFESVGWRALHTGQRLHVEAAYQSYFETICRNAIHGD